MYLARIREYRFVGIGSAAGSVGTWIYLRDLVCDDPGQSAVNAVVGGSLRVEVLDASTLRPLAGYGKSDAVAIKVTASRAGPMERATT